MPDPRFSLIVPAHNESARIGTTLSGYADAFLDSEVIVVLNGCTDDTASVAAEAVGDRQNVRFVSISQAVGKGGAVRAGFLAARAPVVGYVDADGATPPGEMRRLFELVGNGNDGVIGSRWSKGADVLVAQPLSRRIASRTFNLIVRLLFGLPYTDTQCGAKAFSSDAIREIRDSLEVSNFAFDIDVLVGMRKNGRRVVEVPTHWRDVTGSKIALASSSRTMLIALLRLRLRYSVFRYVIPVFDRLWPTNPIRVRNGLALLVLGSRDPKHPRAGAAERYMYEVATRMVADGNRVHWLAGSHAGAPASEDFDGITIARAPYPLPARIAVALRYLTHFRDRFDAVVDIDSGFPMLSPLFSFKPKVLLTFAPSRRGLFGLLRSALVPPLYSRSRFVPTSAEATKQLLALKVPEELIDCAPAGNDESSWEITKDAIVESILCDMSRHFASYLRIGTGWEIVPRRRRLGERSSFVDALR